MTPLLSIQSKKTNGAYQLLNEQLLNAKNDVDHLMIVLRDIYNTEKHNPTKLKAISFLRQQLKLSNILEDLISRLSECQQSRDVETTAQLILEIEIFNEIHFRVKKRYYSFVMSYDLTPSYPSQQNVA